METPATLQEAVKFFADPDNALNYFAAYRWPNGVECPYCQVKEPMFLKTRRIWKCRVCRKQFSVKVGTLFNESPIGLDKWLVAIWLIANCKNGISSYEIARDLGVSQKTAWFMLHRIRDAMQDEQSGGKLAAEVEVDETFIGGKARNMHKEKRRRTIRGRGPEGKSIVAAVLERGGKVRARVVSHRRKQQLHNLVRTNVEAGATVYSDALLSYGGLSTDFRHHVIDHAKLYVDGQIHTNGGENFWSLLKRGINGTYISVEPFHLFRYVDEQAFRFNYRKMTDGERFAHVCRHIAGRRLMWDRLTGKEQSA